MSLILKCIKNHVGKKKKTLLATNDYLEQDFLCYNKVNIVFK
jgi:flagellar biosynthesis/type III secretory pathway chaperone